MMRSTSKWHDTVAPVADTTRFRSAFVSSSSSSGADELDDPCLLGMEKEPLFSSPPVDMKGDLNDVKDSSLVRTGSNGSPICVDTGFFDSAAAAIDINPSESNWIGGHDNIVVHNNPSVAPTTPRELFSEFVDPDKLEEAITGIYEHSMNKNNTHQGFSRPTSMDDDMKPKSNSGMDRGPYIPDDLFLETSYKQSIINDDVMLLPLEDDMAKHLPPVTPELIHYSDDVESPFEYEPVPFRRVFSSAAGEGPCANLVLPASLQSERYHPNCYLPKFQEDDFTMPLMPSMNDMMPTPGRNDVGRNSSSGGSSFRMPLPEPVVYELAVNYGMPMAEISAYNFSTNMLPRRQLFENAPTVTLSRPPSKSGEAKVTLTGKFVPEVWDKFCKRAEEFLRIHGHCLIPSKYPKDPGLAAWAKRQRYQYTLLLRDGRNGKKPSSMTEERIEKLNSIDFVWDIQDAHFKVFVELYKKFMSENGHGKVPKKHSIGRWVGSMRTALRRRKLSLERFIKLEELGFYWSPSSVGGEDIDAAAREMRLKVQAAKDKATAAEARKAKARAAAKAAATRAKAEAGN